MKNIYTGFTEYGAFDRQHRAAFYESLLSIDDAEMRRIKSAAYEAKHRIRAVTGATTRLSNLCQHCCADLSPYPGAAFCVECGSPVA